jgi:hypothetical protein
MNTANYHYLDRIIGSLNTVTDDEVSSIKSPDDERGIRQVIRSRIVREFTSLDDETQLACKNSLRYFLTTGNAPFDNILADQQEWAIESSTDPKQFFIWVWQELFPSEDYRLTDTASWTERNDASKAIMRPR